MAFLATKSGMVINNLWLWRVYSFFLELLNWLPLWDSQHCWKRSLTYSLSYGLLTWAQTQLLSVCISFWISPEQWLPLWQQILPQQKMVGNTERISSRSPWFGWFYTIWFVQWGSGQWTLKTALIQNFLRSAKLDLFVKRRSADLRKLTCQFNPFAKVVAQL